MCLRMVEDKLKYNIHFINTLIAGKSYFIYTQLLNECSIVHSEYLGEDLELILKHRTADMEQCCHQS